jgi:hypothetical protein
LKRVLAITVVLLAMSAPASAAKGFTTVATDPAGDAQLDTYDLTALKVRRLGANLEVRFDLPSLNTAVAIGTTQWVEWRFTTRGRHYAIAASPWSYTSTQPLIELFEVTIQGDDYEYREILDLEGGFNEENGYVWALLPLKAFGGRKGDVLRPAKGFGEYQFWSYSTFFDLYDTVPITKSYRIP